MGLWLLHNGNKRKVVDCWSRDGAGKHTLKTIWTKDADGNGVKVYPKEKVNALRIYNFHNDAIVLGEPPSDDRLRIYNFHNDAIVALPAIE